MVKKIAIFLIVTGVVLSVFGSYVIYIDRHQFWESLYMGIIITLVGLAIISALKSSNTHGTKKALFIIITFLLSIGLATSLLIISSTIKANKNQILTNRIKENYTIISEIGEFSHIVISYPSKGSGRRRNRKEVKSNVYLIRGKDKYARIRTYEIKKEENKFLIDTLIRVHSLDVDDIPFETIKAVENRIYQK